MMGSRIQLRLAGHRSRSDSDAPGSISEPGTRRSQAGLRTLLSIPPLAWGLGYFFRGWIADHYAQDNRRPAGLFLLLTACALVLGAVTWTRSVPLTMVLMSWANFIGRGFQMVALKVGSIRIRA